MPKLLVKHPEKGEMTFPLSGDRITVGRRADNTVQINHGTISGYHAELLSYNGHYLLRDLDSTNHCFIDGIQVSEAELNERCKVLIGTVECEYIPDPPVAALAASSEVEALRKTIGILRAQNEELVARISEQKSQIDILGSARLLTPAAGADLNTLRQEIKTLTAERDKLATENKDLRAQIETLKKDAGLSATDGSLKATVPVSLPHDGIKVSVAPDGAVASPAPTAKVASPLLEQLATLTKRLHKLATALAEAPSDLAPLKEMPAIAKDLSACAHPLGDHPAARLSSGIESLIRDIASRADELEPSQIRTVTLAVDTLAEILVPETLKRCKDLPSPSILAIEDDKELLPAITAALEFSRLPTTGCDDGEAAIETLKSRHFDLVLLDSTLPDSQLSDLCSRIRSLPDHSRMPVVFLTGDENATAKGANDVISKPFNMFELTVKAHTWALKSQLAIA